MGQGSEEDWSEHQRLSTAAYLTVASGTTGEGGVR
jgi:hypothetical protein